jgi:hypothetical protein
MLLRGTAESETRTLTIVGTALVLCLVAALGAIKLFNPFGGRAPGLISIVIDTPYVGEGVASGTAVVMHGTRVGSVTRVVSLPAGGHVLRDGMRINTVPKGNFTLQALLYRLGEVSAGALTPRLIKVVDRGTRYLDGLDPLVETMLIVADAVAGVQSVSSAQLLTNTTKLSVPFPGFVGSLTTAANYYINNDSQLAQFSLRDVSDRFIETRSRPTVVSTLHIFGDLGTLIQSHSVDLQPLVNGVQALADTVPPLIRPDGIEQTLAELRSRFEKMYTDIGGQPALNVRIALDSLPGVAGPLGIAVGR